MCVSGLGLSGCPHEHTQTHYSPFKLLKVMQRQASSTMLILNKQLMTSPG